RQASYKIEAAVKRAKSIDIKGVVYILATNLDGTSGKMYFNKSEILLIKGAFDHAERLAESKFRLGRGSLNSHRYEVKTLLHMEDHERNDRAFAHLCRYFCQKNEDVDHPDNFYFFKVCLQDDRIVDAVKRSKPFIKMAPLLLYIAAHELVHVIRFTNGDSDFDAPLEEKIREEEKVHSITRDMLRPIAETDLALVLDCFSDEFQIGDILN
ncbi:hypothetical protein HQ584_11565, partial [Patescibacteria group bacterium]|nr:hypothetical protein [Patescibacteria group bacterium]